MTAKTLLVVAGDTENLAYEHRLMMVADRVALQHVEERGGALVTDTSNHYDAFASIAAEVEGKAKMDACVAVLSRLDDLCGYGDAGNTDCPTDAACNRWNPEVNAAYYFGLALGLRLAGGSK